MDRRHLQAVWRLAADGGPPAPDADLLYRFAASRDDDAFAELVRRHGRLVWALCRNLLPCEADADDAFQATFLVLARSAGSVRNAARLGPWLHGVAYRVCLKARRSAARRKRHESAAASPEADRPVADAAWDAALAAVHEEVCRLPESLRVPFVLCCLEGKGATEAAEQLGWKLGTLSGRLTRAKQALLARLADRGISAAVVASAAVAGGAASAGVPAAVAGRTVQLVLTHDVVPKAILSLSQGVTGMVIHRTKLLAAAVLVAGGLATGVGSGWLATAEAQSPAKPAAPDQKEAAEAVKKAEAQAAAERVRKLGELLAQARKLATPPKSEFYYVPHGGDDAMTQAEFEKTVRDHEAKGWEFVGVVDMAWEAKSGGLKGGGRVAGPTFVFRRPAQQAQSPDGSDRLETLEQDDAVLLRRLWLDKHWTPPAPAKPGSSAAKPTPAGEKPKPAGGKPAATEKNPAKPLGLEPAAGANEKQLQAEVKRLTAELAAVRGSAKVVTIPRASLGLSPKDMQRVLHALASERFGADGKKPLTLEASDTELTLRGSAEVVEWAVELVQKLGAGGVTPAKPQKP